MTDAVPSSPIGLVRLSSEIVSAYVCRNAVPLAQLGDLVVTVHAALGTLGNPTLVAMESPAKPSPAEIKRSITPEALVSFLDGGRYRMLKRHLARHGLTPAAYRERFGLPGDYPMIASVYRAERSALAKAIGLGSLRKRQAPNQPEAASIAAPVQAPMSAAAAKRGRRPKTQSTASTPVGTEA